MCAEPRLPDKTHILNYFTIHLCRDHFPTMRCEREKMPHTPHIHCSSDSSSSSGSWSAQKVITKWTNATKKIWPNFFCSFVRSSDSLSLFWGTSILRVSRRYVHPPLLPSSLQYIHTVIFVNKATCFFITTSIMFISFYVFYTAQWRRQRQRQRPSTTSTTTMTMTSHTVKALNKHIFVCACIFLMYVPRFKCYTTCHTYSSSCCWLFTSPSVYIKRIQSVCIFKRTEWKA